MSNDSCQMSNSTAVTFDNSTVKLPKYVNTWSSDKASMRSGRLLMPSGLPHFFYFFRAYFLSTFMSYKICLLYCNKRKRGKNGCLVSKVELLIVVTGVGIKSNLSAISAIVVIFIQQNCLICKKRINYNM